MIYLTKTEKSDNHKKILINHNNIINVESGAIGTNIHMQNNKVFTVTETPGEIVKLTENYLSNVIKKALLESRGEKDEQK